MAEHWFLTLLLALGVAGVAYRAGWLTLGGAGAAALVGGIMFGSGGWPWAGLLLAFFVPSTLLSRWAKGQKARLRQRFAKGERRDAAQVWANGGVAALCALGQAWHPSPGWWAAAAGALATATADTWATEIGVLSPAAPRDLLRWRPVPPGTSGAVSAQGLVASALGSLWMALWALWGMTWTVVPVVALSGFVGALADSLLGAWAQALYYCPACAMTTEHHPRHTCGHATHLLRGVPWLDNDAVNLVATLIGALLAGWLW